MSGSTVYFAQAGIGGPIKIGYTSGDPLVRIASLQTGCPFRINLIGWCSGTFETEARFHALFAAHRIEREWFEPAEWLLQTIDSVIAGTFEWPIVQVDECEDVAPRILADVPNISDVIWAAGGPNKIAAKSQGRISADAVHKWRRNGIRDWHWPLLMTLCSVSAEQLFNANERARTEEPCLKVA